MHLDFQMSILPTTHLSIEDTYSAIKIENSTLDSSNVALSSQSLSSA